MNGNLVREDNSLPFPQRLVWQSYEWKCQVCDSDLPEMCHHFPGAPAPTPQLSCLLPAPGYVNLSTAAKSQLEKAEYILRAQELGGKCSGLHGKSIFMWERNATVTEFALFMPGNLKRGENRAQSYLSLCLSALPLFIAFFLVGKKKENQKNQNMGQTLKRGERKMSKATATRHTRNCGCHGEAPSSELHGSATSQPAWLLGCVWVCMTVLGPITQSEQELGRTGVIYSLQGHIPPSLRNCGFWETKQIYSAYLWFYQQI